MQLLVLDNLTLQEKGTPNGVGFNAGQNFILKRFHLILMHKK